LAVTLCAYSGSSRSVPCHGGHVDGTKQARIVPDGSLAQGTTRRPSLLSVASRPALGSLEANGGGAGRYTPPATCAGPRVLFHRRALAWRPSESESAWPCRRDEAVRNSPQRGGVSERQRVRVTTTMAQDGANLWQRRLWELRHANGNGVLGKAGWRGTMARSLQGIDDAAPHECNIRVELASRRPVTTDQM